MKSQRHSLDKSIRYPRVVFIVGTGRSGSTVLDLFLGQHPTIQSAGELCNVVKSGWVGGEFCSCGERVPLCRFWTEVRKIWEELTGAKPEDYESLRSLVEGNRRTLWKMLRNDRPEMLLLSGKEPGGFLAYAQWTAALYRAIAEVSGKTLLIDSSKNPARALALVLMDHRLDLIDLYLIHLVRDIRGFVWSQRKSFQRDERAGVAHDLSPRPVWKSALVWLFVNSISERVIARHDLERTLFLRYEDFANDTLQTSLKLASFLNIAAQPWLEMMTSHKPLQAGHVVAGNRVRMQRHINIKPDNDWQTHLTTFQKVLCWFLAGWKARQYGYTWEPVAARTTTTGGHTLAGPHYVHSPRTTLDTVATPSENQYGLHKP